MNMKKRVEYGWQCTYRIEHVHVHASSASFFFECFGSTDACRGQTDGHNIRSKSCEPANLVRYVSWLQAWTRRRKEQWDGDGDENEWEGGKGEGKEEIVEGRCRKFKDKICNFRAERNGDKRRVRWSQFNCEDVYWSKKAEEKREWRRIWLVDSEKCASSCDYTNIWVAWDCLFVSKLVI